MWFCSHAFSSLSLNRCCMFCVTHLMQISLEGLSSNESFVFLLNYFLLLSLFVVVIFACELNLKLLFSYGSWGSWGRTNSSSDLLRFSYNFMLKLVLYAFKWILIFFPPLHFSSITLVSLSRHGDKVCGRLRITISNIMRVRERCWWSSKFQTPSFIILLAVSGWKAAKKLLNLYYLNNSNNASNCDIQKKSLLWLCTYVCKLKTNLEFVCWCFSFVCKFN